MFYKRVGTFLVFFILFVGLNKKGISDPCPDWIVYRNNLPLCPTSRQASVLSESFPTAAVVVSSKSFDGKAQTARDFTTSFVEQVVRSASSENMPLILLMGINYATENQIRSKIRALNISPKIKSKALEALRPIRPRSFLRRLVGGSAYTWQQDYFEAFTSPSGKIHIKEIQSYIWSRPRTMGAVGSIVNATENCGFEQGSSLKGGIIQALTDMNGYAGGNIEGLPGGFCLLGDDHFLNQTTWDRYAEQFCGEDPSNRIKVPTSWLWVGHADEIVKIVKNNKPQEGQCDFSVALSSPRKATELLAKNRQVPFTSLKSTNHHRLHYLCEDIVKEKSRNRLRNTSPSKGISFLFKYLIPYAYGYVKCNLTNGDVLEVLQGDTFLAMYNRMIQEKLDRFQRLLTEKISSRLSCRPDFIQTPDLYYTSSRDLVYQNGSGSLPKGEGISILPNSTNAVSVGDSIILSEPGGNTVFNEYMEKEYAKRGITARFVNTSSYAHAGGGNLHCATHTIHICRPRSQSQLQRTNRKNVQ